MYTESYAEAVRWLTRAADEFERLGDRQGLSKTLDRITFALYQQGAYEEALAVAGRHLAMATEAGDLAGVSIALNHTGLVRLEHRPDRRGAGAPGAGARRGHPGRRPALPAVRGRQPGPGAPAAGRPPPRR